IRCASNPALPVWNRGKLLIPATGVNRKSAMITTQHIDEKGMMRSGVGGGSMRSLAINEDRDRVASTSCFAAGPEPGRGELRVRSSPECAQKHVLLQETARDPGCRRRKMPLASQTMVARALSRVL